VLEPVYEALGQPLSPETTGAVEDVLPGVALEDVASALRGAFAARYALEPGEVDAETLNRAEQLAPEHSPASGAALTTAEPLAGIPKGVVASS
jgi:hypothetical protein